MPSTFLSRVRCVGIPDSRESSLDIPSKAYGYPAYKPAVPKQPKDDLRETSGLKARISYANVIQQYRRNISPRFAEFVQQIKAQCEKAIKLPSKSKERAESIRTIAVEEDGTLHSYWEKLYGPEGVTQALLEATHAFRELHLDLEYGDYLALNCERYRSSDVTGTEWKSHPEMQWPDVDDKLTEEEKALEHYRQLLRADIADRIYPDTPWLDSIQKAAGTAQMQPEDIRFEIQYYAKRNRLVHSNVKEMVNKADFYSLAGQILADKKRLGEIYGETRRVLDYRLAIGRLESEWYEKPSYYDKEGVLRIQLNAKGRAKEAIQFRANQ